MLTTLTGIIIAIISGSINGSFAVPMKKTFKWEWENIWLVWAFWALIIIPVVVAYNSVPDLMKIYTQAESSVLIKTFILGAGWGLGSVTFGLGVYMVGLSLGFSIIVGVTSVSGALVPMLMLNPEDIFKRGGLIILAGMILTSLGVVFCGKAGAIKDRMRKTKDTEIPSTHNFKLGLIICLTSGVLNSMLNLSFIAGVPIADVAALDLQNSPLIHFKASSPVWVITLLGGFVTNLMYCGFLLIKKGSWKRYTDKTTKSYWFYGFLMGFLWTISVFLYGAGASILGRIGVTVAWVIIMSASVIAGNIWGFILGEWKGVDKKAVSTMFLGVLLLFGSIVLVSLGGYTLSS